MRETMSTKFLHPAVTAIPDSSALSSARHLLVPDPRSTPLHVLKGRPSVTQLLARKPFASGVGQLREDLRYRA